MNELIRWSAAHKGTYWYVAPFYNQAKKIVWQDPDMLSKYCPPTIWDRRNNSELYIPFPNGSILYVMGADKPDSLRGPNPKGVILDEYDDMKPEIWSAIIQPIMTANQNAWCWFMGTPKGRRDLYNKYQFGRTTNNWMASLLTVDDTQLISREALEEAKLSTTEDFFKQEYYCEFLEGAGAFFRRINENIWAGNLFAEKEGRYQIGVDLAKFHDWTVLTPFSLNTFKAGMPERFQQIDWPLQKARVEAMYYRFNKAMVVIDSTGAGEPIYDDLQRNRIQNITPFTFSERSREDLLRNLQLLINQDRVKIPNYEPLITELQSMQYQMGEITESRKPKIKIVVPESLHDDCIMSLALSVWNIPNNPLPVWKQQEKDILKQFDAHRNPERKKFLTGSPYLR